MVEAGSGLIITYVMSAHSMARQGTTCHRRNANIETRYQLLTESAHRRHRSGPRRVPCLAASCFHHWYGIRDRRLNGADRVAELSFPHVVDQDMSAICAR